MSLVFQNIDPPPTSPPGECVPPAFVGGGGGDTLYISKKRGPLLYLLWKDMSGSKTLRTGEPANNIKQVCAPFTSYQPFCLAVSYVHCTLVDQKFFERGPSFLAVVFTFNSTLPLPSVRLCVPATRGEERLRERLGRCCQGKKGLELKNATAKKAGASSNLFSCLFAPYSIIV